MPAGARFGDILDEKVASWTASEPQPGISSMPGGQRGWHPAYLLNGTWPAGGSATAQPAARRAYAAEASTPRPTPLGRPARVLSLAQRRALDCLRSFGAVSLDETFTDDEVKSAFRALALRFHPDRHPGVRDEDRRYLADAFDRMTQAYRQLTAVPAVS